MPFVARSRKTQYCPGNSGISGVPPSASRSGMPASFAARAAATTDLCPAIGDPPRSQRCKKCTGQAVPHRPASLSFGQVGSTSLLLGPPWQLQRHQRQGSSRSSLEYRPLFAATPVESEERGKPRPRVLIPQVSSQCVGAALMRMPALRQGGGLRWRSTNQPRASRTVGQ